MTIDDDTWYLSQTLQTCTWRNRMERIISHTPFSCLIFVSKASSGVSVIFFPTECKNIRKNGKNSAFAFGSVYPQQYGGLFYTIIESISQMSICQHCHVYWFEFPTIYSRPTGQGLVKIMMTNPRILENGDRMVRQTETVPTQPVQWARPLYHKDDHREHDNHDNCDDNYDDFTITSQDTIH